MPSQDLDQLQREVIALLLAVSAVAAPTGATVASGSSIVMATTTLVVRKTVGSATTVTLPTSPIPWLTYVVKDGKGDAATNNITIASAALIDGSASVVMNVNSQSMSFEYDTVTWNIV
jgi:hypothetical protein